MAFLSALVRLRCRGTQAVSYFFFDDILAVVVRDERAADEMGVEVSLPVSL